MKKKLKSIFAVTALLTMAVTMNAQAIESSWLGTDAKWIRQSDDSVKLFETYKKADGSMAKNEWVKLNDRMGVNIWKYFGPDGYVVTDTTTPDGKTVNDRGIWYMHSPDAMIIEVDGYHHDNAYYPFSYDGESFKNEHLGVYGTYTAQDAQENFHLGISDHQNSIYYSMFGVSGPTGAGAGVFIYNTPQYASEEYMNNWMESLRREHENSKTTVTPKEIVLFGKVFKGYTIRTDIYKEYTPDANAISGALSSPQSGSSGQSSSSGDNRIYMNSLLSASPDSNMFQVRKDIVRTLPLTTRYYTLNPDGGTYAIEIGHDTEEEATQLLQWLDSHVVMIK